MSLSTSFSDIILSNEIYSKLSDLVHTPYANLLRKDDHGNILIFKGCFLKYWTEQLIIPVRYNYISIQTIALYYLN